ncbi:helix-turn-helix domain-containing protein [Rossellomorea aquimaris]|uniref:CdaR family transcriptional regulator n=1 Tax=Rossellomorea TaxID=2837508 RepID=UPI001CD7CD00|nr:sugar diacid recognition domain-containing protein [Rossellomorea aquimaris]MCA1061032.1 helix-turn-helix domain-containing protein [Rossellomorea aquimaris]
MQITEELAYPIISKLKTIVHYNINIMNASGVIVASTDPSRMNQVHEGALYVLEQKSPLIISEQESGRYHGSKEGINLPIEFLGEMIGVVGVTGSPQELEQFVKIVKVTVEVMLQQVHFHNQLQHQKTLMDNWLLDLVHPHYFDEQKNESFAHHYLHLETNEKVQIMLVQFDDLSAHSSPSLPLSMVKEELMRRIMLQLPKVHFQSFVTESSCVLGISSSICPTKGESIQLANRLQRHLQEKHFSVKTAVGNIYSGVNGYRKSYMEAHNSLELQESFPQFPDYIHIQDWGIMDLIKQVPIEIRKDFMNRYDDRTFHLSTTLRETLQRLFDCQLNMKETASSLHIHRNTLLYRLESIEELTGLNPRQFDDAILLRFLLIIQEMSM